MTKPAALRKGDTIAIVAPSSRPPLKKLKLGANRLAGAGFDVYIHPQCYKIRGYLAGDDKARAKALMEVFANDRFKAVICARGGIGCFRLLPYLDFDLIRANPKIFVGFSDVTILLQAFNKNGFVTFHGPMLSGELYRKNYKVNLNSLIDTLSGDYASIRLKNPRGRGNIKTYHSGRASGVLTGGNLSLLQKLIGTRFMPSFRGKIVFLEDTDEDPYRIDGYLGHLFAATDIGRAAGFILGEWKDCRITSRVKPSLTLGQVLDDYFGKLKAPIISNMAIGHGRFNLTIPLGVKARLDAGRKILEITERAVK